MFLLREALQAFPSACLHAPGYIAFSLRTSRSIEQFDRISSSA